MRPRLSSHGGFPVCVSPLCLFHVTGELKQEGRSSRCPQREVGSPRAAERLGWGSEGPGGEWVGLPKSRRQGAGQRQARQSHGQG